MHYGYLLNVLTGVQNGKDCLSAILAVVSLSGRWGLALPLASIREVEEEPWSWRRRRGPIGERPFGFLFVRPPGLLWKLQFRV